MLFYHLEIECMCLLITFFKSYFAVSNVFYEKNCEICQVFAFTDNSAAIDGVLEETALPAPTTLAI